MARTDGTLRPVLNQLQSYAFIRNCTKITLCINKSILDGCWLTKGSIYKTEFHHYQALLHIFLNVRISKSSEKGIKLRISRKPHLFHLLFLLFSQTLYLLKLNINKHTFIHIFRKTIYAKPI